MLKETDGTEPVKGAKKRGVKFCPKCGSTEIYWARGLPQLWSMWECRNCGYYGAFVVEDGSLSKKLQEEYAKKHPPSDTELK